MNRLVSCAASTGANCPDDSTVSPQCNTAVCEASAVTAVGHDLQAASSRLITNAATKERLTLAGWVPARRGADDFLRHRSFGAGC